MYKAVIMVSLLLLSSCGYPLCFVPSGILKDEIVDNVSTHPEGLNKNKPETYWVKSRLNTQKKSAGSEGIMISVTQNNVSLCHEAYQDILIRPGLNMPTLKFPLIKDETLSISLNNAFSGVVNEDICNNKNSEIYVDDSKKCLDDYKGNYYGSKFNNSDGSNSNRFYRDTSNKKWTKSKLVVLRDQSSSDPILSEDEVELFKKNKRIMCSNIVEIDDVQQSNVRNIPSNDIVEVNDNDDDWDNLFNDSWFSSVRERNVLQKEQAAKMKSMIDEQAKEMEELMNKKVAEMKTMADQRIFNNQRAEELMLRYHTEIKGLINKQIAEMKKLIDKQNNEREGIDSNQSIDHKELVDRQIADMESLIDKQTAEIFHVIHMQIFDNKGEMKQLAERKEIINKQIAERRKKIHKQIIEKRQINHSKKDIEVKQQYSSKKTAKKIKKLTTGENWEDLDSEVKKLYEKVHKIFDATTLNSNYQKVDTKLNEKDNEEVDSILSELKTKHPEVQLDFKNQTNDFYPYCENMCNAPDDGSKPGCAQTEVVIEHSDGDDSLGGTKKLSYIQSLTMSTPSINGIRYYGNNNNDRGIRSNYPYKVTVDGYQGQVLVFNLGSILGGGSGGYNIRVTKGCDKLVENSLYYYISKDPPTIMPGDSGTHKIDFMSNNGIFTIKTDGYSGDIYYGVKDNGDGYDNNIGYFQIRATVTKEIPKVISRIVNNIKKHIYRILYGSETGYTEQIDKGAVGQVYHNIKKNGYFLDMVRALLLLYVLLKALFYALGHSKLSMVEILFMAIKIGVIFILIGDNSWKFFNDYLFSLFITAPTELIGAVTSQVKGDTGFEFMDQILFRFTLGQTWLQIASLLFAGPVGWVTVCLIFWGLGVTIQCLFSTIIMYLISIMMIAILLCIAPMFIICIFFQRTKSIFDSWIKALIQTAMQPIIVFAAIAMLNNVMESVIYSLFNFEICSTCIFQANIDLKIGKINFCLLDFFLPIGFSPISTIYDNIRDTQSSSGGNFIGLPIPISKVIVFVILGNAMKRFVEISGSISSSMFGSFANLSAVATRATEGALSAVGLNRQNVNSVSRSSYLKKLNIESEGNYSGASSDLQNQKQRGPLLPNNPPPST